MNIVGMSQKNIDLFEKYISLVNSEFDLIYRDMLAEMQEEAVIAEAMKYSFEAGGKRIRPVLVLEFCRLCGGEPEKAVSAACALEMIHTFSLIHDDLPCMDDDDLRRGKPSCHKAYGEGLALLAGDALENLAYKIIAEDNRINDSVKVKLIMALSKATDDMIRGQVIDTEYEAKPVTEEKLLRMYSLKTGALIKAACAMGCICGGGDEKAMLTAEKYSADLGRAFQIIDDILDIVGDQEEFGKPVGSDAENGKITYASLNGTEHSWNYAQTLTEQAMKQLEYFEDNSFICQLTSYLLQRKK